ncbi:MAG: IS1634 family transposase [Cyanobacteria bacterium J06634_5]
MEVQDLDHLGIIAGIVDQMGLESRTNECLGTHPQQIVSPGQGVKAMILNGLGFVSAPLYLYEGFFLGKATSHLLGQGIEPSHLNDDYLGRLLDKVYAYGASQLFSLIAMDAYRAFGLKTPRYHLDSSSFSVHGAYEKAISETEPGCIEITYGHTKDHRPDLKQFITEMICSNDGAVPLGFQVSSGNQADKAVFAERLQAFAQQWDVNGLLIADAALYGAENLALMGDLRWITRVPLTLSAAQALVTDLAAEDFVDSERPGYRFSSVCSTYGGVNQLWVVVENQARIDSDHCQVDKQVEKQLKRAEKQWRTQQKTDFECAEDAFIQAQAIAYSWRYHRLSKLSVVEQPHYEQSGRLKKGATPTRITYRATAKVIADEAAIERAKRKAGRFILATNVVDDPSVTPESILTDYKGQQAPEGGFKMLKDPMFFTSSVFLKTPERIVALATIMGLSLMVYTLAQRHLRQALTASDDTVLNQRKQPTKSPTLRWIFQAFQAIHLVVINGQAQVSNLTPERLKILQCFGVPCQKYYLTG